MSGINITLHRFFHDILTVYKLQKGRKEQYWQCFYVEFIWFSCHLHDARC